MPECIAYFAVKTIGLSHCNGRKPCDLVTAAKHNLREIQAEFGASGHIDHRRMADNTILVGPATAAEVSAEAKRLLELVETSKLKRDHVQAIEVVFSLPTDTSIDGQAYFTRCLEWLRVSIPLPVLLAVVHMDEAAPHSHALLLPVKDGKHVGGALIDKANLRAVRESFFIQVAGPAGLRRDGAKVRGVVKQWAVAAVLARCEEQALPAAMGPLWPVWVSSIQRDPTPAMLALGIDANTLRSAGGGPPSSPIALPQSPIALELSNTARAQSSIALQEEALEPQGQSCVALSSPATPAVTPKTVSVPAGSEIKAVIGGVSVLERPGGHVPKAERLRVARAAEQSAIAKHSAPRPTYPTPAIRRDEGGLTRERDEYVHDLSAWND